MEVLWDGVGVPPPQVWTDTPVKTVPSSFFRMQVVIILGQRQNFTQYFWRIVGTMVFEKRLDICY